MFDALVFDTDEDAWLRFTSPSIVHVATTSEEVTAVLDAVETECRAGQFAVGYVTYEAASAFDSRLAHHSPGTFPLAAFAIFDSSEKVPDAFLTEQPVPEKLALDFVTTQVAFSESIACIKAYLASGDTYQVNFTHQLQGLTSASPLSIFSALTRAQPSPYSAFIETEDYAICSVSPELFFELDGSRIITEPMKGTRPRGRFPEEDGSLRADLGTSPKDRAENLMIVDMVRNDLGRIATAGSVSAEALFSIKRFPTVWQQVSGINAQTEASLGEIFTALFPCASVTGAPKTRTMEIIRELENEPRGVYTGAIGLVKPGRRARFSVAIRTLALDKKAKAASYGVGGGIVWDSDPVEEWHESLTKGKILQSYAGPFRLLETMLYEPVVGVSLLAEHLERLESSAAYFGFSINMGDIRSRLDLLQLQAPARLRLLVAPDGCVEIEEHPLVEVKKTVLLTLAQAPVDSQDVFLFHKTTHRDVYERATMDVEDCDDVILWNEKGELTETTISNLFLEIDDILLTPKVECGLLAGTYRRHLLESGKAVEAVLNKADLGKASRIFVANSVRGMQEAALVE